MIRQLATVFAAVCSIVQSACCYDASNDVSSLPWQPSVAASLLSICSIVCIITVIMACAKWCPRETAEYKVVFVASTVYWMLHMTNLLPGCCNSNGCIKGHTLLYKSLNSGVAYMCY